MTRDEFKIVVREALETVTAAAESQMGGRLPREYLLGWIGGPVIELGDDVAELLTQKIFLAEDQVYPCVDLFLEELRPDGRLLVLCYRAGYKPCRFGEHWIYKTPGHNAGRVGPFKLGCANLVNKFSNRPAG